jgi:hypothetical protein
MISPVEIRLRQSWILSGHFSIRKQANHVNPGLGRSEWIQLGNSGLPQLGGDPGNAILLNGVTQHADLEIGAPGFQSQVPKSISELVEYTRTETRTI